MFDKFEMGHQFLKDIIMEILGVNTKSVKKAFYDGLSAILRQLYPIIDRGFLFVRSKRSSG